MTKTIPTLVILFGLIAGLSGCATMNKNECRNADWQLVGFEDGSRGYAMERIGQHRKACAKVDVTPDINAYDRGYQKGVRQYCTPDRGYREGVNGASYQGVCPTDLAAAFTRAYRDGKSLYELQQRMDNGTSQLNDYSAEIGRLSADVADHEQAIVDARSSSVTRREHLAAIRNLQQTITDLEVNSVALERELHMLEGDYQALQKRHRALGY